MSNIGCLTSALVSKNHLVNHSQVALVAIMNYLMFSKCLVYIWNQKQRHMHSPEVWVINRDLAIPGLTQLCLDCTWCFKVLLSKRAESRNDSTKEWELWRKKNFFVKICIFQNILKILISLTGKKKSLVLFGKCFVILSFSWNIFHIFDNALP